VIPATRAALRVVVITSSVARNDVDVGASTSLLRELGHEVLEPGDALGELDWKGAPPDIAVVEGGKRLDLMREAVASLRKHPILCSARVLACVDVSTIMTLDPESGVDDFILLPLNVEELAARLVLLAARDRDSPGRKRERYGGLAIDREMRQAFIGERSIDLTPYEFQLLRFLVERTGRVFSRQELLARVWGYRHLGRARTVDTHVTNLRLKMGDLGQHLHSVRGVGYKLVRLDAAGATTTARRAAPL
jgi:DNA-binding response OmpR family regulator